MGKNIKSEMETWFMYESMGERGLKNYIYHVKIRLRYPMRQLCMNFI